MEEPFVFSKLCSIKEFLMPLFRSIFKNKDFYPLWDLLTSQCDVYMQGSEVHQEDCTRKCWAEKSALYLAVAGITCIVREGPSGLRSFG